MPIIKLIYLLTYTILSAVNIGKQSAAITATIVAEANLLIHINDADLTNNSSYIYKSVFIFKSLILLQLHNT